VPDQDVVLHPAGTQTLIRGLAVLDAVASGCRTLGEIGQAVACTRSTTHRLATALAQSGYLRTAGSGWQLGPRLMELGFQARDALPVTEAARRPLEALAERTRDTVHLGTRDGDEVLYLDKIEGRRGLEMRSRIGARMPLASTGLGKALMLDLPPAQWRPLHDAARRHPATPNGGLPEWAVFEAALRQDVGVGCAFDREENETGVRCVAAPIRDAGGAVVAAVSVASATLYMPEDRMHALVPDLLATAQAVSRALGWSERAARQAGDP